MRAWTGRRTESVHDYAGVLIPLTEAHLHSHSARSGRTEYEEPPGEDDEDGVGKAAENEGTGMLAMTACEYSVEGLRREVRRGGKGDWSEYESRFHHGRMEDGGGRGRTLMRRSEIKAHQQGHPGYWHGEVQLAAVHPLWIWVVCR
jgi:hypothetical protein